MRKFFLLLMCMAITPIVTMAQWSVSGTIKDKEYDKTLAGAHIQLIPGQKSVVSDQDGLFRITDVPTGKYQLKVSYVGFKSETLEIIVDQLLNVDIALIPEPYVSEEYVVYATRVNEKKPAAYTDMDKTEIQAQNNGRDLPFIIGLSPSVVVTSDAGSGVGYTNFSIRGTDITRINVTLNGVPMNDAESHSVYFVDLPDLASSLDNIQIQRGIGTSTNGSAAFGGSVNLQTKKVEQQAYATYQGGMGSFNTYRNSVQFGTGLMKNKLAFDGRLSKITSDGYIDRAQSDLKSLYFAGGYYGKKDMLKFSVLSGHEETYQAWYGVPKVRMNNDEEGMLDLATDNWWDQETTDHLLNSNNRTYNYYTYDNEVDNYKQDYYQLHYTHAFSNELNLNTALFYTRGKGYYEQYKKGRDFGDYLLDDVIIGGDTITSTDLIQRKWLDNHFYGMVASLNYTNARMDLNFGGGWNQYEGGHYGEVIWAQNASNGDIRHRWYENDGLKTDYNMYAKVNYAFNESFSLYGDLQFRHIDYEIKGTHDNLVDISQNHQFNFFNPKAGLMYTINQGNRIYASFALANREPSRSNYRDADASYEPKPEQLIDYELGYNRTSKTYAFSINLYYMDYKDQLVATGKINNVGDAIMTNVDESFRAGVELTAGIQIFKKLRWDMNYTYSQNKVKNFVQHIDNWDTWGQDTISLGTTNLVLSPEHIGASIISYTIMEGFNASFISKFVGRQYIDNTNNSYNSIDPYFVNDLKFNFVIHPKFVKSIGFELLISNIFSEEYETYGWAYNYMYEGKQKVMDGYFPMAKLNVMGGITIHF